MEIVGTVLAGFVLLFIAKFCWNCANENARRNSLSSLYPAKNAVRRQPSDIDGHWGL